MCSRVIGHVRFVRLSGKWTISEYGVIRGSCLRTGRSIRAQANPRIVEIAETRRGFPDHPFGKNVDSVLKAGRIHHALKIIYGTDAVAGAHRRNCEEFIVRVRDGGQDPMAALVSATSLSAESLGLGNTIGSVAPGLEADIIAFDGNSLQDVTAARRVLFVMKSGKVFVNRVPASAANSTR